MAKEKEAKSHEMCMHHILLLQERIGNLEEEMPRKISEFAGNSNLLGG